MAYKYVRLTWKQGMYESPDPNNGTVLEHREVASGILGRKLSSEETVHHIDEDKRNNNPENLMVFRSQADHSAHHQGGALIDHGDGTFSAERKPIPTPRKVRQIKYCTDCNSKLSKNDNRERCWDCFVKLSRQHLPSKEELESIIWEMPTTKIAEIYNVSDKAVGKWCKVYDIEKPPRGYWTKIRS